MRDERDGVRVGERPDSVDGVECEGCAAALTGVHDAECRVEADDVAGDDGFGFDECVGS